MKTAYHVIVVSLATGTLSLSFIALTYRFWLAAFLRDRFKLPDFSKAADTIALYAGLFGLLILMPSLITGFLLWPLPSIFNSPIISNKILTAFLMLILWTLSLGLRLKRGSYGLAPGDFFDHVTFAAALGGFVLLLVTNAIGGEVAGIGSGFEQILKFAGVPTRYAFYLPTTANIAMLILGHVVLILTWINKRKSNPTKSVE